MKKYILGFISILSISFGATLAQDVFPDSAEVEIKSPIKLGESANLGITIFKNGSKMTNYEGTIYMEITDEKGKRLPDNDHTLPGKGTYKFIASDQGYKEFQKGLEIKKEGIFYVQVADLNDPDMDKILGSGMVQVIKDNNNNTNSHIEILSPTEDQQVSSETIEIIAQAPNLPNSKAIIYVDGNQVDETTTDGDGGINYKIGNITPGKHNLKIEIPDIAGSLLGSSDTIHFSNTPEEDKGIKDITIDPEEGLMVGDSVKITVYTDEMVDTVKMKLSDRPENDDIVLTKKGIGEFSKTVILLSPGEISISLETSLTNSFTNKKYENVKKFTVGESPAVVNIKYDINTGEKYAKIFWDTINGNASSYLVKYWFDGTSLSGEERRNSNFIRFENLPYDITGNVIITPYRDNANKHGAASETIRFRLSKTGQISICGNGVKEEGETCDICPQDCGLEPSGDDNPTGINLGPTCTVQNISTHTEKIGNSYYLIWDKIDNVSKYIVYSSTKPDGSDKVKVYETSDTSYEYPFDYESQDDVFAYFWIVGICDDGTELKLTGATKVQVGPAENFFLLLCLTLLIYFGIKIFRQTEE